MSAVDAVVVVIIIEHIAAAATTVYSHQPFYFWILYTFHIANKIQACIPIYLLFVLLLCFLEK